MFVPLPSLAGALVDQHEVGLIGLDRDGAVIEANARGRELLRQEGRLQERKGRLRARRAEDMEALERILELAVAGETAPGRGWLTTIGAWPDQRPLTVYVNHVKGIASAMAAIVIVVDPWRRAFLKPEQVEKSLGLTPAESQVAVCLAEGKTPREIAETTNRTVHTVRWLVQQALARTWCSRQADLVRLVLTSSHLPVAQPEEP